MMRESFAGKRNRYVRRRSVLLNGFRCLATGFCAFPGSGVMRYTRVATASFLAAVFLLSSEAGTIGKAAAQTPADAPKISPQIQALLKPVDIAAGATAPPQKPTEPL